MKDLVVLVSDKNMRFALLSLLKRPQSLEIRPIRYDIPSNYLQNDPGCLNKSHEFLRSQQRLYKHGLVIFDHDGCGKEKFSREAIEQSVEQRLQQSGWEGKAAAIVIDPELENWVWSASPHVADALGWQNRNDELRNWLEEEGYKFSEHHKPNNPKEAVEAALEKAYYPRSSHIYAQIADTVSLQNCTDPAFLKLKTTLKTWFPIENKIV